MARTEGVVANTFEVTDTLLQSLIDLAHGIRRLGVRDANGILTYEEDDDA